MNGPCWPFCVSSPACPWDCPAKPKSIQAEASARFPQEACGFVLSSGEVIVCENVAEDPIQSFCIDPTEAERWHGRAVAVWHSHCFDAAVPSEHDEAMAVPGLECWIYSVPEEELGIYLPDEQGRLQLLNMFTGGPPSWTMDEG